MKNAMEKMLKIGDEVMWRGAWGREPAMKAKVIEIEATDYHSKDGYPVDEISWREVRADRAVIVLDNGHWCYGKQVYPMDAYIPERLTTVSRFHI